jgi:hypothetical protein
MPTSCSAYPNDAEAHAAVERLIENGTPGARISVLTGRLRRDHRDDLVGSFAGVGGPIATYDDGVRRVHVVTHRALERVLANAGLDADAVADDVAALHHGRVLVLVDAA